MQFDKIKNVNKLEYLSLINDYMYSIALIMDIMMK